MNGWDKEKLDAVQEVLAEAYNAGYEIDHCVRGAFTGAKTYKELANYLVSLGESLIREAEFVDEQDYDSDDELN